MMAAAVAGQRGLRVVLIDHARRLAEKIRISGGGRCNFTNLGTSPAQFLSRNPDFCRSALRAYGPQDFLKLLRTHGVAWHEKHRGQLFCDDSSESIIGLLRHECDAGGVTWRMPCRVQEIVRESDGFVLQTDGGSLRVAQLVLATGGMAIPQLGASDFSLRVARQFGLRIVAPRPALVPLVFDAVQWQPYAALAGVALEVGLSCEAQAIGGSAGRSGKAAAPDPGSAGPHAGRKGRPSRASSVEFLEDLLFTHRGLSGPGILQISSYWHPGQPILIDLAPGRSMGEMLVGRKPGSRQTVATVLAQSWPRRLAEAWLGAERAGARGAGTPIVATGDAAMGLGAMGLAAAPYGGLPDLGGQRLADVPDRHLRALGERIRCWALWPTGTAGYKKAEVMGGGVDTDELDQRSLQVHRCPGLYIVGEAVDVTGWLGGYNFQWAWASGMACGRALRAV